MSFQTKVVLGWKIGLKYSISRLAIYYAVSEEVKFPIAWIYVYLGGFQLKPLTILTATVKFLIDFQLLCQTKKLTLLNVHALSFLKN